LKKGEARKQNAPNCQQRLRFLFGELRARLIASLRSQ
jgi:hypothetical protein